MAELLLFHHAQGLTDGVRSFADELRADGHVVHLPDLYEGRTFLTLDDGIAHAGEVGFGTVVSRGVAAAEGLPEGIVYAGFSLGVMPAQQLAQTRAGARGALLLHSCVDPSAFGGWPDGLPAQVHIMDADPLASPPEEDLENARALAGAEESVEFFAYPGDRHLFVDASLPDYDESRGDAGEAARARLPRPRDVAAWASPASASRGSSSTSTWCSCWRSRSSRT